MRPLGSLEDTVKCASFGFVMSTRGHWLSRVSVKEKRSWSIASRRYLGNSQWRVQSLTSLVSCNIFFTSKMGVCSLDGASSRNVPREDRVKILSG